MRTRLGRHFLSFLFLILLFTSFFALTFLRDGRRRVGHIAERRLYRSTAPHSLLLALSRPRSDRDSLVSPITAGTHDIHGNGNGNSNSNSNNSKRFVVVTAATYSYRHMTANMLCSLRKTGAPYILISLDAEMYAWALERGYTTVHVQTDYMDTMDTMDTSVSNFGSAKFNQVTRDKVSAVVSVLSTGTDVIYVDSDVYFCTAKAVENILHILYTDIDIDMDIDMVSQRSHVLHQPMNSGVYYMRSSAAAIRFLEAHIVRNREAHLDEQVLFNRLLCRQGTVIRDKNNNNYPIGCQGNDHSNGNGNGNGNSNTIKARFLDAHAYPIGCTRLKGDDRHIIEKGPDEVAQLCAAGAIELLHYSCVQGDRKVAEMKRRDMWAIDEYARCTL